MKLEKEIQQTSFKSEVEKLAVNILYTHGWLATHQQNFLNNFDLTIQQYNILRILRGQYPNPISVNLLKERMLDKMSDASRLVERLRAKSYIERKTCKSDRRKSDVKITENGLSLLKKIDKSDNLIEEIFQNLTLSEQKKINVLLDKLRG